MSIFYESEVAGSEGSKRFEHFVLGSRSVKDPSGKLEKPFGSISGVYHKDHYSPYHGTDDNGTPTLFGHHPAQINVHYTAFDPSLRIHAPTMAAHIHQKYNAPIIPSDNLSKYSSQLVEHAKKMGMPVVSDPVNTFNGMRLDANNMNAGELDDFKKDPNMHEMPASSMRRARQHLKELRGKTTQKTTPAPVKNVPLPGMETF
jgi:hypothetical protein